MNKSDKNKIYAFQKMCLQRSFKMRGQARQEKIGKVVQIRDIKNLSNDIRERDKSSMVPLRGKTRIMIAKLR